MANRNISNEIICKYSKDCSSYFEWDGDEKKSKCKSCKNNEYQDPKKDYYEAKTSELVANIIETAFVLGALLLLGIILFIRNS